jgi:hypothetical protein
LRGSQAGHSRKKSKGWSQITLTTSTRSLQLARRMQWAIVSKYFFFQNGSIARTFASKHCTRHFLYFKVWTNKFTT